jgi:hypothetical protein
MTDVEAFYAQYDTNADGLLSKEEVQAATVSANV